MFDESRTHLLVCLSPASALALVLSLGSCSSEASRPESDTVHERADPLDDEESGGSNAESEGSGEHGDEPEEETVAATPTPTGPPKRIFAKRFVVNIRVAPDRDAEQIGYLRAGSVFSARTSEPIEGVGCRRGWFELEEGGFVCNGRDVIAFEGRRLPERRAAQPDFDAPLPYQYGRARRNNTPMYRRPPSDLEAAVHEGFRRPGMRLEYLPDGGVQWAPALPEAEPADLQGVGPDVAPATSSAAATGGVGASATAEVLATPGEAVGDVEPLPPPTLADLEGEPGTALMRRMAQGFVVSLDREFDVHTRRYWRTQGNGFVPARMIAEVRGSDFQGTRLAPESRDISMYSADAGVDGGAVPAAADGPASASTTTSEDSPHAGANSTHGETFTESAPASPSRADTDEHDGAPLLHLPIGYVLSSRTISYRRARNGRPRPGPAPGYHHVFEIVGEETHGDRSYYVTPDGTLFRASDITRIDPVEPPSDIGLEDTWISVDLTHQSLVAYAGRTPVYATLVSTGRVRAPEDPLRDMRTPPGLYRLRSKHVTHTMDGDHAVDGPYSIEDVPYVMYFQLAYALHSAFWHNGFGRPRSHGCVNLAPLDARWIFNWASPRLPERWHGVYPTADEPGTWIWIHGETPEG